MAHPHLTRRSLALLLLSTAAIPIAGSGAAQDRPTVATVSYPLAYFAERLLGDTADILFPVPADSDPSFWHPSIADISAIQSADVIALNGANFASWTTKASLPRSRTVDTSSLFSDLYIPTETITHSHGSEGTHSHTGTASYIWLDFALAARQAEALAAGLIRRMPNAEPMITSNLDALISDLATLDQSAKDISPVAMHTKAISSHPRYQYFGRAYGIEMGAMAWDAHDEITEEQWEKLATLISDTGAKVFIWEATPTPESRDRITEMGVLNVVFPPLANRPASGDFLDGMTQSIDQIKDVLAG